MLSFFHFHVEHNWIKKVISSSFQLLHIWATQVWIMLLWFSEAVIIIWVEASDAKQWANFLMLHIILSLTEQCLQYTRGLSNANNYVMLCSFILRNNSFQTWHFDSLIKKNICYITLYILLDIIMETRYQCTGISWICIILRLFIVVIIIRG